MRHSPITFIKSWKPYRVSKLFSFVWIFIYWTIEVAGQFSTLPSTASLTIDPHRERPSWRLAPLSHRSTPTDSSPPVVMLPSNAHSRFYFGQQHHFHHHHRRRPCTVPGSGPHRRHHRLTALDRTGTCCESPGEMVDMWRPWTQSRGRRHTAAFVVASQRCPSRPMSFRYALPSSTQDHVVGGASVHFSIAASRRRRDSDLSWRMTNPGHGTAKGRVRRLSWSQLANWHACTNRGGPRFLSTSLRVQPERGTHENLETLVTHEEGRAIPESSQELEHRRNRVLQQVADRWNEGAPVDTKAKLRLLYPDGKGSLNLPSLKALYHSQTEWTQVKQVSSLLIKVKEIETKLKKLTPPNDLTPSTLASTDHLLSTKSAETEFAHDDVQNDATIISPLVDSFQIDKKESHGFDVNVYSRSTYESQVDSLFHETTCAVDCYWKEPLLQLKYSKSRALVDQLNTSLCPTGFDKPGSTNSETFLGFYREEKRRFPDCIILMRCGDFYETFGIDAIMLVEHCGLNSMGQLVKAGCPKGNIQSTLDPLTAAGFRVVVYEEAVDSEANKEKLKERYMTQIVCEANPTYMFNLLFTDSTDSLDRAALARPYIGVISHVRGGHTVVEVSTEGRTARVYENLTTEAVASRLAFSVPANPLIYIPTANDMYLRETTGRVKHPPFLPSRYVMAMEDDFGRSKRILPKIVNPRLVQRATHDMSEAERMKNIIVSELLQLPDFKNDTNASTGLPISTDDFLLITCNQNDRTHQLNLETAKQLGLVPDPSIPPIIEYALPPEAPAANKVFLKRLLYNPPKGEVAAAMSQLVDFMKTTNMALPPLDAHPVSKYVAITRKKEANAHVFGDICQTLHSTIQFIDENRKNHEDVLIALMRIVSSECGLETVADTLRQKAFRCIEEIESVIGTNFHATVPKVASVSAGQYDNEVFIPRSFFERNEKEWIDSVRPDSIECEITAMKAAAWDLVKAVAQDFCGYYGSLTPPSLPGQKMKTVADDLALDNALCVRKKPDPIPNGATFINFRDRKGRIQDKKFTTPRVQDASLKYIAARDAAKEAAARKLRELSQRLHADGHIPAFQQAGQAILILSTAFQHAKQANKLGWELAATHEDKSMIALDLRDLRPYWMSRSSVSNSIEMDGIFLLTAPNMSGKSTVMRATAAAALLTICGLCAPLGVNSSVRRFDHIFVRGASSDVPVENQSAFASEMKDIEVLLRCCTDKSLVFVDELGRGTSPHGATILSGAILEAMVERGMNGIFATHSHDIFTLPLRSKHRMIEKRMAVGLTSGSNQLDSVQWTYLLEDGRCTDSMALHTAEQFGVPKAILDRAKELSAFLPEPPFAVDSCATNEEMDNGADVLSHKLSKPLSCIESIIQRFSNTTVTPIPPRFAAPPLMSGRSVVYVLRLDDPLDQLYVGETDNITKRLKIHRTKGPAWAGATAWAFVVPEGKSQARFLESKLIELFCQEGFLLKSKRDSTLRHEQPTPQS